MMMMMMMMMSVVVLLTVVVLSRIKVSFNATVVRLEHVPKDSETGMSLEMRIAR